MKNSDIFKLKTYISELETEAKELQNEINMLVSKLDAKRKCIDDLKNIISEEEYEQRHKEEKSIKDILNKLVDKENGYYYIERELSKIRKDMFKDTDQKDFDTALSYLEKMHKGE